MKLIVSLIVSAIAWADAATAQERAWTLDAAGEDAFLVYGVPESDDVGISIWCKIGTEKTSLFFPVTWTSFKNDEIVPIEIVLGDAVIPLNGKATASEETAETSIEADLPAGPSFFDAMKATDRIKLKVGTHTSIYPLADAQVDGLLKLCREPTAVAE